MVLDSGSTDETEALAREFPNVSWFVRSFDNHAAQWEHGIHRTGISTPYVLALDADMAVPPGAVVELEQFVLSSGANGGVFPFDYCYAGRRLLGSIYPAQLRLFRAEKVAVSQPGHTQVFSVPEPVHEFHTRLIHDDRKSLDRWLHSQLAYTRLEAALIRRGATRLRDRLRAWGVAPPIVGAVSYLRAGGPLAGKAALRYACERTVYECLLTLRLSQTDD